MKMNKKAQIFENLGALAVGIASLCIVLVVAFLIISKGRSQVTSSGGCANTTLSFNSTSNRCCDAYGTCTTGYDNAYNATAKLGSAVDDVPGWVPLIVIAVIGSVILGLVAMFRNK